MTEEVSSKKDSTINYELSTLPMGEKCITGGDVTEYKVGKHHVFLDAPEAHSRSCGLRLNRKQVLLLAVLFLMS